jgi:3-hydroxyacyl-CoA dehydrogenase/enoyl-CoA hydratase/3-hydroxybutyryl-CoA epimerase
VIDRAGKRFGMPMGPIELADVVGLDVSLHVGRVLGEAFRRAPQILVKLVEQKKLGRKSGEGFYVWQDGKAQKNAAIRRAPPRGSGGRLILPMLNEAVAVLARRGHRRRRFAGRRRGICDGLRAFSRRTPAICQIPRHPRHYSNG